MTDDGSNSKPIEQEIRERHQAVTALEVERAAINAQIRVHRAAVEQLTGDKKAFAWARHLATLDDAEKATTHKVAFEVCCQALGIGAPETVFEAAPAGPDPHDERSDDHA